MEEEGKWKQFGLYSSKKLLTESTNRYTKKENHLRQGLYFKNRSAELSNMMKLQLAALILLVTSLVITEAYFLRLNNHMPANSRKRGSILEKKRISGRNFEGEINKRLWPWKASKDETWIRKSVNDNNWPWN
ncbi:unnamed protein product [Porites lobata]|uniref:Uncharacterized protein n=1 Tax=Porites lobata TaxID=104759 RepID=A0ABN8MX79_9CNID|nr:unnamed protein product [Porites lobata]